jgi:hypothetical protein
LLLQDWVKRKKRSPAGQSSQKVCIKFTTCFEKKKAQEIDWRIFLQFFGQDGIKTDPELIFGPYILHVCIAWKIK